MPATRPLASEELPERVIREEVTEGAPRACVGVEVVGVIDPPCAIGEHVEVHGIPRPVLAVLADRTVPTLRKAGPAEDEGDDEAGTRAAIENVDAVEAAVKCAVEAEAHDGRKGDFARGGEDEGPVPDERGIDRGRHATRTADRSEARERITSRP